jgi:hypothetical protein
VKKSSFVWRVGLMSRDVCRVLSRCRVFGAGGEIEESCVWWNSSDDVEQGVFFLRRGTLLGKVAYLSEDCVWQIYELNPCWLGVAKCIQFHRCVRRDSLY